MKVRWLLAAADDLDHVHAFISLDNPTAAEAEVQRVLEAVGRLGVHPAMGQPGRVAGPRELVVPPYVVAYRVKAGAVQVLRVLHAARKFGSAKGRITLSDDFDAPLPDEVLKGFTG